jgi:uncharacterized membrane protein
MILRRAAPVIPLLALLGACHGGHGSDVPGDSSDHAPFHGIAVEETVRFTGTEPFWGGEVGAGRMLYTTPDNPAGYTVAVTRFAGRGGLSFSGMLDGREMVLAITPGSCSDGMSDRSYPFVVTLQLEDELRQGCGWTARQPRKGGEQAP